MSQGGSIYSWRDVAEVVNIVRQMEPSGSIEDPTVPNTRGFHKAQSDIGARSV